MATVYEAICLRDWTIEAANGDKLELKRGTAYKIGAVQKDTVMVFSSFWVRAPVGVFEPPATWHQLGKKGPMAELGRLADDMERNIDLLTRK